MTRSPYSTATPLSVTRVKPNERLLSFLALLWTYVPALVLVGLLICCAFVIGTRVAFASPGYDDSYVGSVARNFAFGRGYAIIYGESSQVFNPEITVGPAMLLPAALLYKLFGSEYWVGSMVVPAIALPLLGVILWLLATRHRTSAATLVVIVAFLLMFSADRPPYQSLVMWSRLLGEVPAVLFVVLAAVLASSARTDRRLHLTAGLCLSLAFYTKVAALLALPGFVFLYGGDLRKSKRLQSTVAFIGGGLVAVVAFEMFRLAHLGSVGAYVENSERTIEFYRNWTTPDVHPITIWGTARALNIELGLIPLLVWMGVALLASLRAPLSGAAYRGRFKLSMILLLAGATHLLWWWQLNDSGWIKHLVPGVLYLCVGLPLLGTLSRLSLVRYSGLVVVLLLFVPQVDLLSEFEPMFGREARLSALNDTASFLRPLDTEMVSLWGCGWWANRDLNLAGDLRFYDCSDLGSVERHLEAGEKLLLVRSENFNWENNPRVSALAKDCDSRVLFWEEPFIVCDATPWLQGFTSGRSP